MCALEETDDVITSVRDKEGPHRCLGSDKVSDLFPSGSIRGFM